MPIGSKPQGVLVRPALLPCAAQAAEVSLGDHLERLDVEDLIGDNLFEPGILFFEVFQPLEIADLQTSVLCTPRVERRFADAVFSAQLRGLFAALKLPEDPDDLRLGKSRLAHVASF